MALDSNMVNSMIERFISAPVSLQLIKNLTQALYDMDIAIHYDDDLTDYVGEDDQPCFTPPQAQALNGIIDKMTEFCRQHGMDIHDVAGDVQRQEWKKRGLPVGGEREDNVSNMEQSSRRGENELELNGIKESELKEDSLDMSGDLTSFQYKDWMGESTGYFNYDSGVTFLIVENDNGWLKLQEAARGGKTWYEDVVSFGKMIDNNKYVVTGDKLKINEDTEYDIFNKAYHEGCKAGRVYYNNGKKDGPFTKNPYSLKDNRMQYAGWMEGFKFDSNPQDINEDAAPIQNHKTRSDKKVKTMRNMINHTKAEMKKEHDTIDNGIGAQKVWQVDAKINESHDQVAGIMDYLAVAKQALEVGKIKGIMDSAISDPKGYDGDVYFTIENIDGSHDTIQKELGGITLYQNIDSAPGMGYDDDDISLDGFKKYLLGGDTNGELNEMVGDEQGITQPNNYRKDDILDLSGQALADYIKGLSRENIISWLQGNDPNGIYDDGNVIAEAGKPLTWRECAVMMYNQIARSNGSGEISETVKKNKKKINESMGVGPAGGLETEEFENARNEDDPNSAYDKGREAYCKGVGQESNPFSKDHELSQAWNSGWKETNYETLHEGKSFEHLSSGVEFKVKSFDKNKVVLTDGKKIINEDIKKFNAYLKDGSIRPSKFQECIGDYGNTKTEINEMAEGDMLFQKVFDAWRKGGEQTKKWIARKIGVNNNENSIKRELSGMGYEEINEVINMLGLMREGLEHLDRGNYTEDDVETMCAQPEAGEEYVITNDDGKKCTVKIVSANDVILKFRIDGVFAKDPRTTSTKHFCDLINQGKIVPKGQEELSDEDLQNLSNEDEAYTNEWRGGLKPNALEEDEEYFDEGPQPGDSDYHNQKYNQETSDQSLVDTDWRVFYEDLVYNNQGGTENMSDFCEGFGIDMDGLEMLEENGLIDIIHGIPKVDVNVYPNWQSFKQKAIEVTGNNSGM